MLNFFKRWVLTAILHSPGVIDFWIGAISAILAVADHWRPGNEIGPSLAWQIPIWAALGVLSVRLILAPYWMSEADTQKILDLEKALDDKEAKAKALKQLWGLRRNGVELRNRDIKLGDEEAYSDWKKEYGDWRRSVLIQAQILSVNLENWLETLNELGDPPSRTNPFYSKKHQLEVSVMSEMLRRMENFLQKKL
jgi:hypothetical protein